MTTPATIVQPDLEAWVWAQIGGLAGVTSFVYAAAQHWPGWVYEWHVQVDARSARKSAARDLAEHVRQLVLGLPEVAWSDGVVCYVQPTEGPFYLPDPDGHPRYCARYEIRSHPQGIPPAALAAHPPRRKAASRKEM
jgi:hypothetical protein